MMFLNKMMKEKNMTRADLSRASSVPESTLRDILNGKTEFFRCEVLTVSCIADALDTTVEDLLASYWDEQFDGEGEKDTMKMERHDNSSMIDFYVMVNHTMHKLHASGDLGFINALWKDHWIERFYDAGFYRSAFFLLGLITYLSRRNGKKLKPRYDALRSECLDQPVYSLRTLEEADNTHELSKAKANTESHAIPELACFNIYMTEEDITPQV